MRTLLPPGGAGFGNIWAKPLGENAKAGKLPPTARAPCRGPAGAQVLSRKPLLLPPPPPVRPKVVPVLELLSVQLTDPRSPLIFLLLVHCFPVSLQPNCYFLDSKKYISNPKVLTRVCFSSSENCSCQGEPRTDVQ